MSEAYAYRNGFDPAFLDDTDMVECDTCGREYDYKEYRSLTCSECESKGDKAMDKIWGNNEGDCAWCLDKPATKEYVGDQPSDMGKALYQVCDEHYEEMA